MDKTILSFFDCSAVFKPVHQRMRIQKAAINQLYENGQDDYTTSSANVESLKKWN
ncbi:MAG: hypothetical protein MR018_03265 [Clostridiales bacterium]|nr:hypothetical protein [Clostridiales bacterium]MDD7309362.1 hypothetical protein [Eubacteriales bacterium]MDY5347240.1 hypothetical protein [Eubacteriales bacterium]